MNLWKNWKTSVTSVITASFGFVVFSPELFVHMPWLVAISKYAMVGGLAAMGVMSKDFNAHSTIAETEAATVAAEPKLPG